MAFSASCFQRTRGSSSGRYASNIASDIAACCSSDMTSQKICPGSCLMGSGFALHLARFTKAMCRLPPIRIEFQAEAAGAGCLVGIDTVVGRDPFEGPSGQRSHRSLPCHLPGLLSWTTASDDSNWLRPRLLRVPSAW